ncbi:apolipoprotein D [Bradysia coprophila]|uniref:apolipoprotein D n=1 Tax=Bradysia coprophila TaxID=38358 RepID=UPI00187D8AF0|nr:apolipoprotein D [Bradysia coprophila]XP_037041052.1 apolipoprotein D [Bradysia coprophila]
MKRTYSNGCFSVCLVIIATVHFAYSSGFGRLCPKYPSMPKFNITMFLGKWYEVERTFYLPEIASSCTTLTFDQDNERSDSDRTLDISIDSINQWTGSPSQNIGHASRESENSSIMDFQFTSRLPNAISRFLPGAGRYQVLFTDYDNFAILWSCSSFGSLGYTDQIWLLGRNRTDFVLDTRTTIHDSLIQLGLDPERLVLSKNDYCPEL